MTMVVLDGGVFLKAISLYNVSMQTIFSLCCDWTVVYLPLSGLLSNLTALIRGSLKIQHSWSEPRQVDHDWLSTCEAASNCTWVPHLPENAPP